MVSIEWLGRGVLAIDLASSLILAGYVVAALFKLLRGRGLIATRLALADGAVLALSIKTAAALLRTIEVRGWEELGTFVAILALRMALKRVFGWEAKVLRRGSTPQRSIRPD